MQGVLQPVMEGKVNAMANGLYYIQLVKLFVVQHTLVQILMTPLALPQQQPLPPQMALPVEVEVQEDLMLLSFLMMLWLYSKLKRI
jgi:hypothetical protein